MLAILSIMGKASPKKRKIKIQQKQKRKKKLKKLRELYKNAKSEQEKQEIFAKALKISPALRKEDFISGSEAEK